MTALLAYASLFVVALGAASLLPIPSEPLLIALLAGGQHTPWLLVLVASLGNILGSVINWLLGRYLERFRGRRWFPVDADTLLRAELWYRRWGRWSLLLSWMPIIGDPLTLIAGVLREPLRSFLVLVAIAKVTRYVALTLITLGAL